MVRPENVVVHPLVLLSVVDHYTRAQTENRVVGVLLGTKSKGVVDVTNSYAVPFDEDEKNPNIWYLDFEFHEQMFNMFKKVQASEKVVGWYSTGPKIRPADLDINERFRAYCSDPVFVVVDVEPKEMVLPTEAYLAIEEIADDNTGTSLTFQHLPSEIGAMEAEEVGVEHLLRDITDATTSDLSGQVTDKLSSLNGLLTRLREIETYLRQVLADELPVNHQVIYQLQNIFNLLPDLDTKSFAVKTNDQLLVIYLSSIIRSVIALHDLINNKLELREAEQEVDQAAQEAKNKAEEEEKKKKEGASAGNDDKEEGGSDNKESGASSSSSSSSSSK